MFHSGQAELHIAAEVDLILCIYIILQNSLILGDYYADRRRVATAMFMLIAAADMAVAACRLVGCCLTLICIHNLGLSLPWWLLLSIEVLGFGSYNCSIFYNTFLMITKTVNIVNPFYRIDTKAIKIAMVAGSAVWIAVSISDIIFFSMPNIAPGPSVNCSCSFQGTNLPLPLYTGQGIIQFFIPSSDAYNKNDTVAQIAKSLEFLLPSVIVFICMVIQMAYIKQALSMNDNPAVNTANHVNLTVFMVSTLYVICNGLYGLFSLLMVPAPVLPLLNAALFPTILILRKASLRNKYAQYVLKLLTAPVRAGRWVWSMRQGYEVLN